MVMLERTNIQERIQRTYEERPFEPPGVIEAEPEKSEGEMATSALPSTVIKKKEEDERTEEEKQSHGFDKSRKRKQKPLPMKEMSKS